MVNIAARIIKMFLSQTLAIELLSICAAQYPRLVDLPYYSCKDSDG